MTQFDHKKINKIIYSNITLGHHVNAMVNSNEFYISKYIEFGYTWKVKPTALLVTTIIF